jgi:hypothetical protein
MSSVGYAQGRRQRAAAAKERRKKLLAVGGVVLLILVLAIQVPRTLKMMNGDSSGAPSTAAPAASPAAAAPAAKPRKAPRFLRGAAVSDPFASRGIADGEPAPGSVSSNLRDPFQGGSTATAPAPAPRRLPLVGQIVVGTPGRGAPKVGYTVVLASIPTSSGRAQAVRFAGTARARGVANVGVLQSSTRNRLRPGYWVVYSGEFRNVAGVQRAASRVHAQGYSTAYVRQLVRY